MRVARRHQHKLKSNGLAIGIWIDETKYKIVEKMIELYGNIWDNVDDHDAVVITTNGFVKKKWCRHGSRYCTRGQKIDIIQNYLYG